MVIMFLSNWRLFIRTRNSATNSLLGLRKNSLSDVSMFYTDVMCKRGSDGIWNASRNCTLDSFMKSRVAVRQAFFSGDYDE